MPFFKIPNMLQPPEEEPPYTGPIWGKRFILFGLILILGLGGLAIYRHIKLGVPLQYIEEDASVTPPLEDSIHKVQ